MIEQTGKVVRVVGDRVWVEAEQRSSCGDCSAKMGCGHALIGKALGGRLNTVQVRAALGVQTGDCVVLGVREDALLRSSLAVYLLPLAGLILGAVVGTALFVNGGDLPALLGGGLGFAAGMWWVRGFGGRAAGTEKYQPVILRRIDTGSIAGR